MCYPETSELTRTGRCPFSSQAARAVRSAAIIVVPIASGQSFVGGSLNHKLSLHRNDAQKKDQNREHAREINETSPRIRKESAAERSFLIR